MILKVNTEECLRAGQCHHLAPQLVGWRDDDYPEIIARDVPALEPVSYTHLTLPTKA